MRCFRSFSNLDFSSLYKVVAITTGSKTTLLQTKAEPNGLFSNNFSNDIIRNVFTADLNCFSSVFFTSFFLNQKLLLLQHTQFRDYFL